MVRYGFATALIALAMSAPASAVEPGQPAPDFTLPATNGKSVHLADLKGKIVVLEWTNHECPFVRAHYDSGVMQGLQARAKSDGVTWLTIVSSAPGRQGYVDAATGNAILAQEHAEPAAKLLDADGTVGHLYDAKATPHMFVIDAAGKLAYMGAIDDRRTDDAAEAKAAGGNLVAAALDSVEHGKPVATPVTVAYGCSIKYGG